MTAFVVYGPFAAVNQLAMFTPFGSWLVVNLGAVTRSGIFSSTMPKIRERCQGGRWKGTDKRLFRQTPVLVGLPPVFPRLMSPHILKGVD